MLPPILPVLHKYLTVYLVADTIMGTIVKVVELQTESDRHVYHVSHDNYI